MLRPMSRQRAPKEIGWLKPWRRRRCSHDHGSGCSRIQPSMMAVMAFTSMLPCASRTGLHGGKRRRLLGDAANGEIAGLDLVDSLLDLTDHVARERAEVEKK